MTTEETTETQETTTEETQEDRLTPEQEEQQRQAAQEAEEAAQREQQEVEQKPWFKQRFDEITRQKYAEKERADKAEKRLQELEQRLEKVETKPKEKPEPTKDQKPKLSDYYKRFDDVDDAVEAFSNDLTEWKLNQHVSKQKTEQEKQAEQDKKDKELQTFNQKVEATKAAGRTKFKDWDEVVLSMPGAIMHDALVGAIVELDDGDAVSYYLGKNLQEAEKISQLSPYAMAAELGKIQLRLSKEDKKTTKAPPPPGTVKGKAAAAVNEIDPAKDPKGWIEARNKAELEKRGALT